MSGKFIVIEGLDGAGTTTQAGLLRDWLAERGTVLLTREPTDRSVGRVIRKVLAGDPEAPDFHALPWLFAADRADHLFGQIDPALKAGTHVISDRYYHSSLAYQSLTLPLGKVAALNDFRAPDLTLFVDVSVDICLQRIEARGDALEIFEKRDRLERIAGAYQEVNAFLRVRGELIEEIDGAKPVNEVFEDIRASVEQLGV